MFLGDYSTGQVIDFAFTTLSTDGSGEPAALTGASIDVYRDNETTSETTAGVTLTSTFDSVVGFNHVRIQTTGDTTFYAAGRKFIVMLSSGTVGGSSVGGYALGMFRVRYGLEDDIADETTGLAADIDALTSASSRLEATTTAIYAESTATAAVVDGIAAGTTMLSTDADDLLATTTAIVADTQDIQSGTTTLSTKLDDLTSSSSRLEATTTAIYAESTATAVVLDGVAAGTTMLSTDLDDVRAETTAISSDLERLTSSSSRLEASTTAIMAGTTMLSTDLDDLIATTTGIAAETTSLITNIWAQAMAELSTAMPATPSFGDILAFQHMSAWNLHVTTASSGYDLIYNDAGSQVFQAAVTKPTTDSFQRAQFTT